MTLSRRRGSTICRHPPAPFTNGAVELPLGGSADRALRLGADVRQVAQPSGIDMVLLCCASPGLQTEARNGPLGARRIISEAEEVSTSGRRHSGALPRHDCYEDYDPLPNRNSALHGPDGSACRCLGSTP